MEQREYVTSVYMSVPDKELRFVTWYAFLSERFLRGIFTTSLYTNSKERFAAGSWGANLCGMPYPDAAFWLYSWLSLLSVPRNITTCNQQNTDLCNLILILPVITQMSYECYLFRIVITLLLYHKNKQQIPNKYIKKGNVTNNK